MNFKNQKTLSNTKGMSLVEVMIVVVVMSLIGLGTTTLIKNIIGTQRRSSIKASMVTIRKQLEDTLNNDAAWANTITAAGAFNATRLSCINDNPLQTCASVPPPAGLVASQDPAATAGGNAAFDIRDGTGAGGVSVYNPTIATAGFTVDGEPCNTFDAAAGDDNCPFRWDVEWFTICPPTGGCTRPKVVIHAFFRVSTTNSLITDNFNPVGLDFIVRRGEKLRIESFQMSFFTNNNPPVPASDGGGDCSPGNPVNRKLNQIADASGNITLNGNDTFDLPQGTYECEVNAQGYATPTGFTVAMVNDSTGQAFTIGTAYTGPTSTAYVSGTVSFQVAAGTETFSVQHTCSTGHVTVATVPDYELGIPAEPYANGNTYTTVSCTRSF